MQTVLRTTLRSAARVLFRGAFTVPVPTPLQRAWVQAVSKIGLVSAPGTTSDRASGAPFLAHWVRNSASEANRVLLYVHGGGFAVGSAATHLSITSHLARAARATVLVPAYRLVPEHPYPAALEDVLAAYHWLLERHPPEAIAVGGDSAGGGLAVKLALALRDQGFPLPAGLVLISPWVDMTLTGESHTTMANLDPMLAPTFLSRAVAALCGTIAVDDPRVSPLFADLRGLPPMLIEGASDEILLSDAESLTQRARDAGVTVQYECAQGMWHVYQMHAGVLAESNDSIARIAAFLDQRWASLHQPARQASNSPGRMR